ncbi:AAA domain-containing protein [Ensifer adhaerens]|uniref:AAA domain-containing protein n=1 Tax=Ensifer adhaerens TaxID=106592 RepID=UPI0013AFF6A9
MTIRDQILSFLRNPASTAQDAEDPEVWLSGLDDFAVPLLSQPGQYPLRPAQIDAWRGLACARTGLILGPPGTGKTHLLNWLILGYINARRAAGLRARVLVTAFTRNAIGNVVDAVAKSASEHCRGAFDIRYFGSGPANGLHRDVLHRPAITNQTVGGALNDLNADAYVLGASVWTVYRLLRGSPQGDGYTADLFDLVCIDEASQMVLAHGLIAHGGLRPGGRLVVAGDDRQLPPIRSGREIKMGERQLGGSLYGFLKSSKVPEFALDETFRLNQPLASFPERKFYPGAYRSAVPESRIEYRPDWQRGLAEWEVAALHPDHPIVILLHDGPTAANTNSFEAGIVSRLAEKISERLGTRQPNGALEPGFWSDRLAIVSPHRAQNAAIRNTLAPGLRPDAFVETVDRIQGKERDAILLSYCVADPEFAVAEAEFIFAPERLNVAVTRARKKLIVVISRRLLDAVPTEQEQMDKAELLREFVFAGSVRGTAVISDAQDAAVPIEVRSVGFDDTPPIQPFEAAPNTENTSDTDLGAELQTLLDAVRQVSLASPHGSATLARIERALATSRDIFPGLARLHALGWINLDHRSGPHGYFWIAKPFDRRRKIFDLDSETLRRTLKDVIARRRAGRAHAFYEDVRRPYAWMDGSRTDCLKPLIDVLQEEGLLSWRITSNTRMLEWVETGAQDNRTVLQVPPRLLDADFALLNTLEEIEAKRINFGVFEGWVSIAGLAEASGRPRQEVATALPKLIANGWVMSAEDGRVRSRMAELARELRYVKQRFDKDDADDRPYLVRSLKVELRDRDKPERNKSLIAAIDSVAAGLDASHADALRALQQMLVEMWGPDPQIAGFQQRSLKKLSHLWARSEGAAVAIAADTGSGKTEAAVLPLIATAAADYAAGKRGTRAILAYPRVRLATNQAQRIASYLAAFNQLEIMPSLTLGVQIAQIPRSFSSLREYDRNAGWAELGAGDFAFPLFNCPRCACDLTLRVDGGNSGADRIACTQCDWRFDGWIGTKEKLQRTPPTFFLPTTDSLHQWMHDRTYGRIFGDDRGWSAPRALVADEIHLYSHVHGAQVGYTFQRLAGRVAFNSPSEPLLLIGMSATLGDPGAAWAKLLGQASPADLITPADDERKVNPRGREYFYFVQPEVESRGKDIAGASTSIQSIMCLAHGMRRRTGKEGGFRSLVFLDSIDKVRRLHAAYEDAENQALAKLRIAEFPDDPVTGAERTSCCGEPHGCDAFRKGECWFFAANDQAQEAAGGRKVPGTPLAVANQPVFSGATGRVENLIRSSDVVFSTSSLEVGYDDPDITMVYQHYAPANLASFIQRKGRGGRGADDRPTTAVTLSIYSNRDTWWFQKPRDMIEPSGFETPMNPGNYFVRRGQVLSAMLDAMTRRQRKTGVPFDLWFPPAEAIDDASQFVEAIFGKVAWKEFGQDSLASLWRAALGKATEHSPSDRASLVRERCDWIPNLLFDTINLPRLAVDVGMEEPRIEDVIIGLNTLAPGNATRRYDGASVMWIPPVNGQAPWFAEDDYSKGFRSRPFGDNPQAWLDRLPDDASDLLAGLSADYFRPTIVKASRLGQMFGAAWQSDWHMDGTIARQSPPSTERARRIRHDSRSTLRGFPIVKKQDEFAESLELGSLAPWLDRIQYFRGDGLGGQRTGLALAKVYWGADAEAKLEDLRLDPVPLTQIFTSPGEKRPTLHGYHVQTEGLSFKLNANAVERVVDAEISDLERDAKMKRWRTGQMLRFLIENKATFAGVNAYEAMRGAEIIVSAAADPELRRKLNRLRTFWGAKPLEELFEETRSAFLSQHPLLTVTRVQAVAASLSDQRFQKIFQDAIAAASDEATFRRYLTSTLVHSLTSRIKASFANFGGGDERRVVGHTRLPIQFKSQPELEITVCEAGAFGDGTARSFVSNFAEFRNAWINEVGECPNAEEDAACERFFENRALHDEWAELDPFDTRSLRQISSHIGLGYRPLPATIIRILFGTETIGAERFSLYDLTLAVREVKAAFTDRVERRPTVWELASAAVARARQEPEGALGKLLAAYDTLEEAMLEEALSPEGRLADQVLRMNATLCFDGCRACVHQSSDMMSDNMVESSTSRTLLRRFLCAEV